MEPTSQEKIDYIYDKMKSDEKRRKVWLIFKWWIRLLIPIFIAWIYFYGFNLLVNKITWNIKEVVKIDTKNLKEKWIKTWDTIKEKGKGLFKNNENTRY